MEEEEHEVYGGEIPDVGEMEGDMDPHNADIDMSAADDEAVKVLFLLLYICVPFNLRFSSDPVYDAAYYVRLYF